VVVVRVTSNLHVIALIRIPVVVGAIRFMLPLLYLLTIKKHLAQTTKSSDFTLIDTQIRVNIVLALFLPWRCPEWDSRCCNGSNDHNKRSQRPPKLSDSFASHRLSLLSRFSYHADGVVSPHRGDFYPTVITSNKLHWGMLMPTAIEKHQIWKGAGHLIPQIFLDRAFVDEVVVTHLPLFALPDDPSSPNVTLTLVRVFGADEKVFVTDIREEDLLNPTEDPLRGLMVELYGHHPPVVFVGVDGKNELFEVGDASSQLPSPSGLKDDRKSETSKGDNNAYDDQQLH
jgi:hypothetical protein